MEPMLLSPVGKDYLWGGNRLKTEYGKRLDVTPLAETWECSAHPNGPSKVRNGTYAGQTLDKVLKICPKMLGTHIPDGSELPILVKFIDAAQDLSIQVHPDDKYAAKYEQSKGKSEMWYVMDAEPGSKLVHGFAHDMTPQLLRSATEDGSLIKHVQQVEVHKQDVFYMPAGTIHGIGAGCLIAEIQENSDVTYRVYDYNRVDKHGRKRELHFDKSLEVLNLKSGARVRQVPRLVKYYPGCQREVICRCQYFETEKVNVTRGMSFSVLEDSFQVILCLEGEAGLETTDFTKPLRFRKGDCIFLPAGLGRCMVIGECEFLKVRV